MFGINKNGTKEKIGILLPASYPSNKVTYGAGTVKDALDVVAYKNRYNVFTQNQTIDGADGTAGTLGETLLAVGNITPQGTAGNSRGNVILYGSGTGYSRLISSANSGRINYLPDADGTIALTSDVNTKVSKSGDTMSGNLTIDRQDGSQMIGGQSILTIGNNLGIDQDKNSEGLLYLYAMSSKKTVISSGADGSDKTIEFPNKSGTVALTSDISDLAVTQALRANAKTISANTSETINFNSTMFTPRKAYLLFAGQAYVNMSRICAIVICYGSASILMPIFVDSNVSLTMSNGVLTIAVSSQQTNVGIIDLGYFMA